MTEPTALDLLFDRAAAAPLAEEVKDLVVAAAAGDDALAASLGGDGADGGMARPAPAGDGGAGGAVPPMFLSSVAVQGFRGIAGEARLGLTPAPGLTLVVGRNGSGKSTFAEAAELALTGTTSRWAGKKTKAWREGWANIHHDGPRSVELKVALEGDGDLTTIRHEWAAGADLEAATSTWQRAGSAREPLASVGIDAAMSSFRPILSYNELGSLLEEGPSRLYDAISAVLGIEEWTEVQDRIDGFRKQAERDVKAAKDELSRLHALLGSVDDERAVAVRDALAARKAWRLDDVERLVTGQPPEASQTEAIEALVNLPAIDVAGVRERVATLREWLDRDAALAGTDAGRAQELASLLEQALTVHDHTDGDCPVCGTEGALGPEWVKRTTEEVTRLRREARAVEEARREVRYAVEALSRSLTNPPPALLTEIDGLDTAALRAQWIAWADTPDDPAALAEHAEKLTAGLAAAVEELRAAAASEVQRRADVWQPVAAQVAAWLPAARIAVAAEPKIKHLKDAAKWVADEANVVRNERFAPIAAEVQEIWETMRQTSNVSLDRVALAGTKTRRQVALEVSVDDVSTAALSVMSQGELHTLALSLFIPRATLAASPFRFVLVDDPVQSMDAARVDGLARVLARVAERRQVVVFTHDERLPEACRRLDLPAKVLEVTRGERSQVGVRAKRHPVDDYLADAMAVAKSNDAPDEAKKRVIPGLCRNALEAACAETARRRLLAAGRAHAEVDELVDRAMTTTSQLALALFGDAERGGEVLPTLNAKFGKASADLVQTLKKGAHDVVDRDADGLIRDTAALAKQLLALKTR